jgi:hypothetical protein
VVFVVPGIRLRRFCAGSFLGTWNKSEALVPVEQIDTNSVSQDVFRKHISFWSATVTTPLMTHQHFINYIKKSLEVKCVFC